MQHESQIQLLSLCRSRNKDLLQERFLDAYDAALDARSASSLDDAQLVARSLALYLREEFKQQLAVLLALDRRARTAAQNANELRVFVEVAFGSCYFQLEKPETAQKHFEQSLGFQLGALMQAEVLLNMGYVLYQGGQFEQARSLVAEALIVKQRALPEGDEQVCDVSVFLAQLMAKLGQTEQAETVLRQQLENKLAIHKKENYETALISLHLCQLSANAGDLERARQTCASATALIGLERGQQSIVYAQGKTD